MADETPSQDLVTPRLRVLQIITGALITGVMAFLAVVLLVQQQGQAPVPGPQTPLISLMAAGGFVGIFGVWLVLPPTLVRQGLVPIARHPSQSAAETVGLLALKQTVQIVSSAMLEGCAFFNLVAFLVERQTYTLGIALACVLLMLVTFPTQGRFQQWLLEQQERLQNLRLPD